MKVYTHLVICFFVLVSVLAVVFALVDVPEAEASDPCHSSVSVNLDSDTDALLRRLVKAEEEQARVLKRISRQLERRK